MKLVGSCGEALRGIGKVEWGQIWLKYALYIYEIICEKNLKYILKTDWFKTSWGYKFGRDIISDIVFGVASS